MSNLIKKKKKTLRLEGYLWHETSNLDKACNISDAKTDPFIPFGADLCVYLKHIDIPIINITGKNVSCVIKAIFVNLCSTSFFYLFLILYKKWFTYFKIYLIRLMFGKNIMIVTFELHNYMHY